jgi:hypothetical protein
MEVVSVFFSCHPVGVMAGRREHPLPSPLLRWNRLWYPLSCRYRRRATSKVLRSISAKSRKSGAPDCGPRRWQSRAGLPR